MPSNMQKKAKVAALDDEAIESRAEEEKLRPGQSNEVSMVAEDDPRYQAALLLLQRGNPAEKIADKLMKEGAFASRPEALRLAKQVQKENPQEQRTNAKILFGAAIIFTLIGLIVIVPDVLKIGVSGLLQPQVVVFLVAGWFAYKGLQTWKSAS